MPSKTGAAGEIRRFPEFDAHVQQSSGDALFEGDARCILKWFEVGEQWFENLVGKPPCGQTAPNAHRSPSEVEIEITQGCRHRWPRRVVQNDKPARADDSSKKVQVHKDFMKAAAPTLSYASA